MSVQTYFQPINALGIYTLVLTCKEIPFKYPRQRFRTLKTHRLKVESPKSRRGSSRRHLIITPATPEYIFIIPVHSRPSFFSLPHLYTHIYTKSTVNQPPDRDPSREW